MNKFLAFTGGLIMMLWYWQIQTGETNPPAETKAGSKYTFPIKNKTLEDVISGYGDARGGGSRIHEGIDIPDERGTPVLAVIDGKILKVVEKGNGGKQIWLKGPSKTFFYAHLDSWSVEKDQIVEQGDVIGTVGNTGNARHTLPHLHFGVYTASRETMDPALLFTN